MRRVASPARRGLSSRGYGRSAFTLIELLVSISILSILASAVLFASFGATEAARRDATQSRVNAIHSLLMEQWETYKSRRPRVDTSGQSGENAARIRLEALRLTMLMEMPDRWSDVIFAAVEDRMPGSGNFPPPRIVVHHSELLNTTNHFNVPTRRTALAEAYLRRYNNLNTSVDAETIRRNQGAECLYMIIMLATADGEARSLFNENMIGDVDGDGAPEFIDGWGNPITYIRWPAGFQSELQAFLVDTGSGATVQPNNAAVEDHDPYDVFHRQPFAFRLMPLIHSPGPDGESDILAATTYKDYNLGSNPVDPFVEPFAPVLTSPENQWLGSPILDDGEDNTIDNIHNHIKDVK